MAWNWSNSGTEGAQGASIGYSAGGGYGALAGGIIGALGGGLEGSNVNPAGLPQDPLVGMSDAEYNWYNTNINPLKQNLINYATDPNTVQRNVQAAQTDVAQQFANNPQAFKAGITGRGGTVTAQQQRNFNNENALNEGIASVGAANTTRAATAAQQQGIVSK